LVGGLAYRPPGEAIHPAANEVTQRVATEGVRGEQEHVDGEYDRPDADAEVASAVGAGPPQRPGDGLAENAGEKDRDVQKVAMHVVQNEREGALAEVLRARLTDGARRRVGPERLVIGAAIVIAGEAKTGGERQNQHRRRDPQRHPAGRRAEPAGPVAA